MKIFIRIMRTLLGVILLCAFGYGLYISAQTAPHASDFYAAAAQTPDVGAVPATPAQNETPASEQTAAPTDTAPTDTPDAPDATPEPTPAPTPDTSTPAGRAAALGLPAPPDIDIDSWEFMLVNGDNSIGEYAPEEFGYLNPTIDGLDVQTVFNPYRTAVDVRIGQALLDFSVAAENEGLNVYLASGYRGYADQAANFQRVCANNGVTDGKDANGNYITMPAGCSEHQSGLCCDITDKWYDLKTADALEQTALYQWMSKHCQEYGFIVRYPKGGEEYTHVMYEPWHFRYVGVEAATYIMETGITFEQFVALYK